MAADGSQQADAARIALETLKAALLAEVRRLLEQLDTARGSAALLSDREATANAARVLGQVQALMAQRGIAVTDVLEEQAAAAALAVADAVDLGGFEPDATAVLDEIVRGQTGEVLATFDRGRAAIGEAMRVALTTGAELGDLVGQVAQEIETTVLRAQAAVDAAVMAAGRAVTIRAGEGAGADPDDPIVYRVVGPRDGKVRDWCRAHVGQCWSTERLDADDTGDEQPQPPSVYLGGYNCRHSLAPMLASEARARGYVVNL